ncbi:MAG TPA: ISNCY family transposase [Thermomicrobiales bacterium]|nr:ISNCY family transposase [Thermomicrobiales bacterium]
MRGDRQQRVAVVHEVAQGQLTVAAAAAVLGGSERQVWRLLAAYRRGGAGALRHGNAGRQPAHTISAAVRQRVVTLAQTTYQGCNEQHLSALLAEREGLTISRSSLRRILRAAEIGAPRQTAPAAARRRRARYPRAGMLVQIDASPHDWLEGRGPWLTLLAAIDDATNEVPAALFRLTEDAQGYFLLLQRLVAARGRPLALYHDRHGIFQPNPKRPWSVEEQLAGQAAPTQFGRLLAELGIASIAAQSPQAKGRVERLFGTLQDRLVSELRLAGVATLDAANQFLATYLPKHNRRFAVPAAEGGSAYRPLDPAYPLETLFCFKYQRTVAADNTVRFGEHRLQLLPGADRVSWAKAPVEVHERLDGELAVYYHGTCVATRPAPPDAPTLRARAGRRPTAPPAPPAPSAAPAHPPAAPAPTPRKPARNHPWRRQNLLPDRPTKSLDKPDEP